MEEDMEKEYFDWDGWDQMEIMDFLFYNVKFVKDLGCFKKGEEFGSLILSYEKGIIEAYNKDETEVVKSQKFTWQAKE